MEKIITMASWRRPKYFKEVINSLVNAEGIEDYKILVSIDGGYTDKQSEMLSILRESNLNFSCYIQSDNFGCSKNTHFILSKGFEITDRVIHLEDDTVIHPKALRWFEHNLEHYEHDLNIFSISGYNNGKLNNQSLDGNWTEPHVVGIRSWFSCWGWATWKRVWDEINEGWFGIEWKEGIGVSHEGRQSRGKDFLQFITTNEKGSWGIPMNHYWRNDRFEISPHTSFIQNIGVEDSTWATEEVHKYKQFTDWFKPELAINELWEHYFVEDFLEGLE